MGRTLGANIFSHLLSNRTPSLDVKENFKEELEFVVNSLKSHSYVAIGEIGIDLYWDKTYLKQQVIASVN